MREAGRITCLSGAIAFGLLISSCSDPTAEANTDPAEPGAIKGVLLSGTADYIEENRSEKVFALQRKDGSLLSLKFSDRPQVPPGSEVFIWGTEHPDGLHVERVKLAKELDRNDIGRQSSPITDNPPALTPPLRAALVSVNPAYTCDMVAARITRADFITPVMEVSSYGRWTMEWDTFGPFTIPNDCGGSFYDNVGKNGVAAMQAAGIDTSKYDQIQFLLPQSMSSCGWTGFGWDGRTPIRTDGLRGKYNPWSYTKSDREGVMVQEIGHNWGLAHVHFCPNTQTPTPNCPGYVEYGSTYSPLSSGNNVYLNGWERIQMNFLSGCNVLTVATSGTFDIGPLTYKCSGPQILRIAADDAPDATPPHQRYYYIEYRRPVGIENYTGVLVHYSADIKVGGWSRCDYGGPDCPEDWVINPMGGNANQALLQEGAMWTTPQGIGIRIVSLGDTAKFEITAPTPGAAPTCMDGNPWNNAAPVCQAGPPPIADGGLIDGGMGTGGSGGGCGTGTDSGRADSGGAGGAPGADATVDGDPTRPPGSDAGTTGGQAGTGGTGGSGGSGGTTTPPPDSDGCGCRLARKQSTGAFSALALAAALSGLARRRRRNQPISNR